MLGRRLLNSVNAGQCAEFSEHARQIPAEFSETLSRCLLNSANAGQKKSRISCESDNW